MIGDSAITDLEWIELEIDTFDIIDDQTYKIQQLFFEMSHVMCRMADEDYRKRLHGH